MFPLRTHVMFTGRGSATRPPTCCLVSTREKGRVSSQKVPPSPPQLHRTPLPCGRAARAIGSSCLRRTSRHSCTPRSPCHRMERNPCWTYRLIKITGSRVPRSSSSMGGALQTMGHSILRRHIVIATRPPVKVGCLPQPERCEQPELSRQRSSHGIHLPSCLRPRLSYLTCSHLTPPLFCSKRTLTLNIAALHTSPKRKHQHA